MEEINESSDTKWTAIYVRRGPSSKWLPLDTASRSSGDVTTEPVYWQPTQIPNKMDYASLLKTAQSSFKFILVVMC